MSSEIYNILQNIMIDKNITIAEMARMCDLPDSTVRGIITRKQKNIALEVAFKLSKGLGVTLEELNGEKSDNHEINTEVFGLKVSGRSMEPRIYDGDLVIVRRQSDIESGEIGVVDVDGGRTTTKKIIKQDGGILLVGLNSAVYTPKFYPEGEYEIVGKVLEVRGNMDAFIIKK